MQATNPLLIKIHKKNSLNYKLIQKVLFIISNRTSLIILQLYMPLLNFQKMLV
jgi:hypothetical protein